MAEFFEGRPSGPHRTNRSNNSSNNNAQLFEGKVLPHHQEAERSVIGAILVKNDVIDLVREAGLKPEHFYRDAHKKIFEVACQLSDRRDPIDLVLISTILKDKGWYDSVGGTEALTELFVDAFAVGNAVSYAKIVRDKAIHRRMIEVCSEIITQAFSGVENTDEFMDQAESQVFSVADVRLDQTMVEMKKILIENMKSIEDLALRKEDVTGLSTGFRDLDMLTTGFHPGQVIVLAARPGMGKTSWILSAIQHAALAKDSVCAFFSLEMSKVEIGFKLLSGLSKIDSRKLKTGRLADRDWLRLSEAADKLSKSKIHIDDSGSIGVLDIRTRCRRLLAKEKKLDLIIVDYLQLMKGSSKSLKGDGSREREIAEISRGLKELSKELGAPIIALSQLNRSVESRQDKRPMLADLRESGAIEQDADIVMFIHREDYYDKETENKGIAEIIVAKNRSGEQGTIKLAWLGQYTLFANLAEENNGPSGRPVLAGARSKQDDITL